MNASSTFPLYLAKRNIWMNNQDFWSTWGFQFQDVHIAMEGLGVGHAGVHLYRAPSIQSQDHLSPDSHLPISPPVSAADHHHLYQVNTFKSDFPNTFFNKTDCFGSKCISFLFNRLVTSQHFWILELQTSQFLLPEALKGRRCTSRQQLASDWLLIWVAKWKITQFPSSVHIGVTITQLFIVIGCKNIHFHIAGSPCPEQKQQQRRYDWVCLGRSWAGLQRW